MINYDDWKLSNPWDDGFFNEEPEEPEDLDYEKYRDDEY
jgi:hypothetical protein